MTLFACHRRRPTGSGWRRAAVVAAALASLGSVAHASGYSESASGDLSNNNLAPTSVGFALGSNIVSGNTSFGDNDYMTFTVPHGEALTSIVLLDSATAPDRTFFGIASGSSVVVDPSFTSAAGLIGWTLINDTILNSNVLPDLGRSAPPDFPAIPGATGFSGPLGAGTYSTWLVDGDASANYRLDFQLTAVPEPSAWLLMAGGLGLIGWALRRRARVCIAAV